MPYIEQKDREQAAKTPTTAGELNYAITFTLTEYLKTHKLSYQTINDIVGALEAAKAEFQRRVVNPYENLKMAQNGDVYD